MRSNAALAYVAHEATTEEMILEDLNVEQRAAVLAIDRPTLVLSPAGTGKTKTFAARFLLMLERGTSINRILAITFSNRAAHEMRERVAPVLQGVDERDIFIKTFHALGADILRSMPTQFGLTDKFRVADTDDCHKLMRDAIHQIDPEAIEDQMFEKRSIERHLENIDFVKSAGFSPSMLASANGRCGNRRFTASDVAIMEEYESLMVGENMVDFNDLILKPLLAFRFDAKKARAWSRRFDCVMVDEYQDTNQGQFELLQLIVQDKRNFMALGDDDQLIFQWRGADTSYVTDFEKQWADGQVLTLVTNYRNSPELLSRASRLIGHNVARRQKNMRAARTGTAILEHRSFDAEADEIGFISRTIKTYLDAGKTPDQIAVLTRSRLEASKIANSLSSHGIPCYSPENDILQFKEVRALISWARIINDQNDRLAMLNAMATPDCGLGARATDMFMQKSRTDSTPLIDVLRQLVADPKRKGGPLDVFVERFDAACKLPRHNSRFFEELARSIGLDIEVLKASPAANVALSNAYEIFRTSFEETGSIAGVLEAISLSAKSNIEARQGQARVRVDTMHSTKGLEYDIVFASAWEEGNFPKRGNEQTAEEERRLAYVTLTRARDAFFVTNCTHRSNGGSRTPSRFLNELGLLDTHY